MPRTPQEPHDFGAMFSEINRRLSALETTNPLRNAAMSDPAGVMRLRLGRLAEDVYGIEVRDRDGVEVLKVSEEGMNTPYIPITVFDSSAAEAYNGASFVDTKWWAQAETMSHAGLYLWVAAFCEPGVTGEVRISCPSLGTTTDALTYTATGSPVLQQFRWLHGAPINNGPYGFRVQARRTAGAGNFFVYHPNSAALAAGGLCTPTGV